LGKSDHVLDDKKVGDLTVDRHKKGGSEEQNERGNIR